MWHEIGISGIDSNDVLLEELRRDNEVKKFLTTRLELLLRGYKLTTAGSSGEVSSNQMFIERLIASEMNLIKSFIKFLATD